jgi:hypothetical protein
VIRIVRVHVACVADAGQHVAEVDLHGLVSYGIRR